MSDFQPLSDIWDVYTASLDEAVRQGFLDDDDLSENYVWPADLDIGEWEQKDVQKYVHERMVEIVERIKTQGGINPNIIAGYIFRSVICGMMFEMERIGR
jgi:hypothetical protein